MKKRILALMLSASMAFTMCSPMSMAAEDADGVTGDLEAMVDQPEEESDDPSEEESVESSEEELSDPSEEAPVDQLEEELSAPLEEELSEASEEVAVTQIETPVAANEESGADLSGEEELSVESEEIATAEGNYDDLVIREADAGKAEAIEEVLNLSEQDVVQSYDIHLSNLDGSADVTLSLDELDIPEGASVTIYHFLDSAEAIESSDNSYSVETDQYASEFESEATAAQEYDSSIPNDTVFVEEITAELDEESNVLNFTITSCSTFTVDFSYNEQTYSIPGKTKVKLSEVFQWLGYTDHQASDATEVVSSDSASLQVEQLVEDNDWQLTSVREITTDAYLTVTFSDGETLRISLTSETGTTEYKIFTDESTYGKIDAYWIVSSGNIISSDVGLYEPTIFLQDQNTQTQYDTVGTGWSQNHIKSGSKLYMNSNDYWFEVYDMSCAGSYVQDSINMIRFSWVRSPSIHITRHSTSLFGDTYGDIRQKSEFVMSDKKEERTVDIHINGDKDPTESAKFLFPNREGGMSESDIASIVPKEGCYVKRSKVTGESDVTIEDGAYHIWLYTMYQVAFDANGGYYEGDPMENQSFIYGVAQTLNPNIYKKAYTITYHFEDGAATTPGNADREAVDFDFEGWQVSGSDTVLDDEKLIDSALTEEPGATVTLSAIWNLPSEKASVTLRSATHSDDGSGNKYRFKGWYLEDGTRVGTAGDSYTVQSNVDLYARWETLTTLTIQKEVTDWNSEDANQVFVFTVKANDDDSDLKMTVTVHGNGKTVIHDVPVGNYTVTEDADWSWQYPGGTDKSIKKAVTADSSQNLVTFTDKKNYSGSWLVGFSKAVECIFGKGDAGTVQRSEGGDAQ